MEFIFATASPGSIALSQVSWIVSEGMQWLQDSHLDETADIAQCWQDAFRSIAEDPQFQAEAPERLGPFPLIIGDAAGPIVARATSLSEATVAALNDALAENRLSYRIGQ